MRAYHGRIFRLQAHVVRLYESARYLGARIVDAPPRLAGRLTDALAASRIREAIVRVALIPDTGDRDRPLERPARPSIVVQPVRPPTPSQYRRGICVAIVPARRFPISQIDPQAKFSARLGSILALQDAQLRGVDEAIFTDGSGYVTESTASNLGIIKRGALMASPCWLGLLPGITWQALIDVARGLSLSMREAPLTRHDLYNADEAFLSSTIKELLGIRMIDGRLIGSGCPGPVTKRLHQAFRARVRRELRISHDQAPM